MAKHENDEMKHSRFDDWESGMSDFNFDDGATDNASSSAKRYIMAAIKGTFKGTASAFAREIGNNMPSTRESLGEISATFDDLKAMQREFSTSMQSDINAIRQSTLRLMPMTKRLMPTRLYDKLMSKLQAGVAPGTVSPQEQLRQSREAAITGATEEITGGSGGGEQPTAYAEAKQNEQRQTQFMDRVLGGVRFKELNKSLGALHRESAYQSAFLRGPFTAWMRKDLELKYRQLFTQQDIFESVRLFAQGQETYLKQLVSLAKMPDILKVRGNEILQREKRGRSSETFNTFVSDYRRRLLQNVRTNYVDVLKQLISTAAMGMGAAEMGAEMAGSMGNEGKAMAVEGIAGIGGIPIGRYLAKKTLGKYRPVANMIERATYGLRERAIMAAEQWRERNTGGGSFFGDLIDKILPKFNRQNVINNTLTENGGAEAVFDNYTRQTIVEIMPGYMAKMAASLKSIDRAVGGRGAAMEVYDPAKRGFVTVNEFKNTEMRRIFGDESRSAQIAMATGEMKSAFTAQGGTDAGFATVENDLKRFIANHAFNMRMIEPQAIAAYAAMLNAGSEGYPEPYGKYLSTVFANLKNPKSLATFLTATLMPNNQVDNSLLTSINNRIIAQTKNDTFRQKLAETMEIRGQGWVFNDLMKAGGAEIDRDKLIDVHLFQYGREKGAAGRKMRKAFEESVENEAADFTKYMQDQRIMENQAQRLMHAGGGFKTGSWLDRLSKANIPFISEILKYIPTASVVDALDPSLEGMSEKERRAYLAKLQGIDPKDLKDLPEKEAGLFDELMGTKRGKAIKEKLDKITGKVSAGADSMLNKAGEFIPSTATIGALISKLDDKYAKQESAEKKDTPAERKIDNDLKALPVEEQQVVEGHAEELQKQHPGMSIKRLRRMATVLYLKGKKKGVSLFDEAKKAVEGKSEALMEQLDATAKKHLSANDYAAIRKASDKAKASATDFVTKFQDMIGQLDAQSAGDTETYQQAVHMFLQSHMSEEDYAKLTDTLPAWVFNEPARLVALMKNGVINAKGKVDFGKLKSILTDVMTKATGSAAYQAAKGKVEQGAKAAGEAVSSFGSKAKAAAQSLWERITAKSEISGESASTLRQMLEKLTSIDSIAQKMILRPVFADTGAGGQTTGPSGIRLPDTAGFTPGNSFESLMAQYVSYRKDADDITRGQLTDILTGIGYIGEHMNRGFFGKFGKLIGGTAKLAAGLAGSGIRALGGIYGAAIGGGAKVIAAGIKAVPGVLGAVAPVVGTGIRAAAGLGKAYLSASGRIMGAGLGALGRLGQGALSGLGGLAQGIGLSLNPFYSVFGRAKNFVLNTHKRLSKPKYFDVYRADKLEPGKPLLSVRQQEDGVFFANGNMVARTMDIDQPVFDAEKRTLITADDIKAGLVDIDNKPIKYKMEAQPKGKHGFSLGGMAESFVKNILGVGGEMGKFYFKTLGGLASMAIGGVSAVGRGIGRAFGLDVSNPNKSYQDRVIMRLNMITALLNKQFGPINNQDIDRINHGDAPASGTGKSRQPQNTGDQDKNGFRDGSYQDMRLQKEREEAIAREEEAREEQNAKMDELIDAVHESGDKEVTVNVEGGGGDGGGYGVGDELTDFAIRRGFRKGMAWVGKSRLGRKILRRSKIARRLFKGTSWLIGGGARRRNAILAGRSPGTILGRGGRMIGGGFKSAGRGIARIFTKAPVLSTVATTGAAAATAGKGAGIFSRLFGGGKVAAGAAKVAGSAGLLKGAGAVAARALPRVALKGGSKALAALTGPLAPFILAGLSAVDGVSGYNRAAEILGKNPEELNMWDKGNAAAGSILSGLTFGLMPEKWGANIAKYSGLGASAAVTGKAVSTLGNFTGFHGIPGQDLPFVGGKIKELEEKAANGDMDAARQLDNMQGSWKRGLGNLVMTPFGRKAAEWTMNKVGFRSSMGDRERKILEQRAAEGDTEAQAALDEANNMGFGTGMKNIGKGIYKYSGAQALVGGIQRLTNWNSEATFGENLKTAGKRIVGKGIDNLRRGLKAIINPRDTMQQIKDWWNQPGVIAKGIDKMKEIGGKAWDGITSGYNKVVDGLKSGKEWVKNAFSNAKEWLSNTASKMWTGLKDGFGAAITGVTNFLKDPKKYLGQALDWAKDKVKAAGQWVQDKAADAANWAKEKASGAWNWIKGKAQGAVDWVNNGGREQEWMNDTSNDQAVAQRNAEEAPKLLEQMRALVTRARSMSPDALELSSEQGEYLKAATRYFKITGEQPPMGVTLDDAIASEGTISFGNSNLPSATTPGTSEIDAFLAANGQSVVPTEATPVGIMQEEAKANAAPSVPAPSGRKLHVPRSGAEPAMAPLGPLPPSPLNPINVPGSAKDNAAQNAANNIFRRPQPAGIEESAPVHTMRQLPALPSADQINTGMKVSFDPVVKELKTTSSEVTVISKTVIEIRDILAQLLSNSAVLQDIRDLLSARQEVSALVMAGAGGHDMRNQRVNQPPIGLGKR